MAAQSIVPAPASAGRYIRVYLLAWGVLALGGLGYLASLAWQPELFSRKPSAETAEADRSLRVANSALAEVGSVRRALGEVQRDLGQVRETLAERDAQDKLVQSRITALEERIPPAAIAAAAPEPAPEKAPDKTPVKAPDRASADKGRKSGTARVGQRAAPSAPSAAPREGAPGLETGSIAAQSPPITFGEPVVTPSRPAAYAVQLGAGPTRDAIRLSWSLLLERHATALGALQPHIVPPRADASGPFRLLAGPLASRAEADRLCAALGVGPKGCFATTLIGEPL